MAKKQYYLCEDGDRVPLFEADTATAFKVFRSDQGRAVIGDPLHCIEARGLCRLPGVVEARVGSGRVAYVVYAKTNNRPYKHCLRYIISSTAQRTRDDFDLNKKLKTQVLMLRAPSAGQTLSRKRKYKNAWDASVKNGSHTPAKREKPRQDRIQRLGVSHRPRAVIKAGVVAFDHLFDGIRASA